MQAFNFHDVFFSSFACPLAFVCFFFFFFFGVLLSLVFMMFFLCVLVPLQAHDDLFCCV